MFLFLIILFFFLNKIIWFKNIIITNIYQIKNTLSSWDTYKNTKTKAHPNTTVCKWNKNTFKKNQNKQTKNGSAIQHLGPPTLFIQFKKNLKTGMFVNKLREVSVPISIEYCSLHPEATVHWIRGQKNCNKTSFEKLKYFHLNYLKDGWDFYFGTNRAHGSGGVIITNPLW